MFIVIEGADGAGKTTQVARLAAALARSGYDYVVTHEPTDGDHGVAALAAARAGRDADALEEFILDRQEHLRDVVLPALDRGAVVVCDRYVLSTLVYQRHADPPELFARMARMSPPQRVPDLCVVIDMPVQKLRRRLRKRAAELGGDARGGGCLDEDLGQKVDRYRRLAKHYHQWCCRIRADGLSADETHRRVCAAVKNRCGLGYLEPLPATATDD